MKIKVLVLGALIVALKAGVSWSAMPFFGVSGPESKYTENHSTMTVSSATLTVAYLPQTSTFRQVTIGDPKCPSRVFFTTDGSSQNISARGDWVDAGSQKTIETGNKIWFQVENGTAPVVIRVYQSLR